MCCLYGVYSNTHLTKGEREAFIDLGSISYLRGSDSTGICTVTKKKPNSQKIGYDIKKLVEHPVNFFTNDDVRKYIYKPHVTSILGHSRLATHGEVNEINAHPIREGDLVGTHNGTVSKYAPDKKDVATLSDSRLLYRALDKGNFDEVLNDLPWSDAYALAFLDLKYQTLNFIRNDKRPLWFVQTKEGSLFWASESHMIFFALGRNKIEVKNVTELKPEDYYCIDFISGECNTRPLKKKEVPKYPGLGFPQREKPNDEIPWKNDTGTQSGGQTSSSTPNICDVVKPGHVDKWQDTVGHTVSFMNKTRSESFRYPDPLAPSRIPEKQSNIVDFSTWESDLKRYDESGGTVKPVYPFLVRPTSVGGYDPDQASYQLRKYGVPTWVSVKVAESHLARGCDYCSAKSSVDDVTYWHSPGEHLCEECYDLEFVKQLYHKKEFIKCDLLHDTHISLHG